MLNDRKNLRIRKTQQYNNIYQNGRKLTSQCLIFFVLKNNLTINRYGIVASKKVGNAVVRNKAKRRTKAIIAEIDPRLKQGYDIVLVCRPLIGKVSYDQLKKDFSAAVRKIGIC